MRTSETFAELAAALVAVQAEIEPAPKDSTNPHFKSTYADLASVWKACRSALAKYGLAVVQSPTFDGNRVVLITRLIHKSGQWIENELSIKPQQDTAQGIGSCITYARRYSLAAMVGVVADEDDDGHEASRNGPQQLRTVSVQQAPRPVLTPAPKVEAKIFDKNNLTQATWLEGFLKEKGIASDSLLSIADHLHGKDLSTELMKAINEFKSQNQ